MSYRRLPLTTKIFILPMIAALLSYAVGLKLGEITSPTTSVPQATMAEAQAPKQIVETAAQDLIDRHEAAGLKCQTEPKLTDTIVFIHMDGDAETVTFDEALELGSAGAGYVRGYCL